jgi:hypothetical protein
LTRDLFHGRNHPKYQEIEIFHDFLQRSSHPEIRDFMNTYVSVTKSGHPSRGQRFDFLLEEENRSIKKWISRGVASDQDWQNVICNKDHLQQIYDMMSQILDISDGAASSKIIDLSAAITEWRICMRENVTLFEEGHDFVTLSGEELDFGFLHFAEETERKRGYRILEHFLNQPYPDATIRQPIFITASERKESTRLEKSTINTIALKIEDLINQLSDSTMREEFHQRYIKQVKRKPKAVYIAFFTELEGILQGLVAQAPDEME